MKTKVCNRCGIEKDLNSFRYSFDKRRGKYYYRSTCRMCENNYKKEYRETHKEQISIYMKKYRKEHKDEIKQSWKKYYKNNNNEIKKQHRIYTKEHKDECHFRSKKWKVNHKEETREYERKRFNTDSIYRAKVRIRNCIRNSFVRKGLVKSKKTEQIVGIHLDDLYYYLLDTFEKNYGYKWDEKEEVHIDHKTPLSTANTEEDVIQLCHYTNLQLLKGEDNLEKSDRLDWTLTKDE